MSLQDDKGGWTYRKMTKNSLKNPKRDLVRQESRPGIFASAHRFSAETSNVADTKTANRAQCPEIPESQRVSE
jgi:hypothetical protein